MKSPEQHPTAPDMESETPDAAIAWMPRGPFSNLRRRIALTWQYLGPREVLLRIVTFPIRFTPVRHRLKLGSLAENRAAPRRVLVMDVLDAQRSPGLALDQGVPGAVSTITPGYARGRVVIARGAIVTIGPVAFVAAEPARLRTVSLRRWRSLCGRELDWIELVRRG